jgi:hypothetical protein
MPVVGLDHVQVAEALEGVTRFYVSDPFGNRIELLERGA